MQIRVADIDCKLRQLDFVKLQTVSAPRDMELWQEYVSRDHYLGYKKPFEYYLHYFIGSDRGLLGCLYATVTYAPDWDSPLGEDDWEACIG